VTVVRVPVLGELSARLVKLTRDAARELQRGDRVYEPHRASPTIVKYTELRVQGVEGGGDIVLATRADSPRGESHRKIHANVLMVERKPEPMSRKPPPAPIVAVPPNATTAPSNVDYRAFRDMGQSMLEAVERDMQALSATHEQLRAKLDERGAMSRRRIEQLEAELVRARKAYDDDRALVALEADDVAKQIADAAERLTWLRSMPGNK